MILDAAVVCLIPIVETVDIPVPHLKARFRHRAPMCQRHVRVAAVRSADDIGFDACHFEDEPLDVLHLTYGRRRCPVKLVPVVRHPMKRDEVTFCDDSSEHFLFAFNVVAENEKRGFDLMFLQHIEQCAGLTVRPVVKRQIDKTAVIVRFRCRCLCVR